MTAIRGIKTEKYGVSIPAKSVCDMFDGTIGFTPGELASLLNHCGHPQQVVWQLTPEIRKAFLKELTEAIDRE